MYIGCQLQFNPFPHNKILDQTKLKAFADVKLNVTKMIISVFDRQDFGPDQIESICRPQIKCNKNDNFCL